MNIKFNFVLENESGMKIQNQISIPDDSLLSSLKAFAEFQKKYIKAESKGRITLVDFCKPEFVSPLFTVLTKVFLNDRNVMITGQSSYMEHIQFNETLFTDGKEDIESKMEEYKTKSFLPVVSFPANKVSLAEKGAITLAIENLITANTSIPANIASGIKYMIAEISDNILEHASATTGFIYAQAYRSKQFIDICIGDNGLGLKEAYKKANHIYENDQKAMEAANNRVSSKKLPDNENRGYGLYTSKRILSKGLDGEYMMISGNCAYHLSSKGENYITLREPAQTTGTIVLLRIPYKPNKDFSMYNFYE